MKPFFNLKKYLQKYLLIFIVFFAFIETLKAQISFNPIPFPNAQFGSVQGSGVKKMKANDFNGDGIQDVVTGAATPTTAADMQITFGTNTGAMQVVLIPAVTQPQGINVGIANGVTAIATGDFDGDGDPDIANLQAQFLYITKNAFPAPFGAGAGLSVAGSFSSGFTELEEVDFDRDGDLDLVTLATDITNSLVIILYTNNGAGIFTSSTKSSTINTVVGKFGFGIFNGVNVDLIYVNENTTQQDRIFRVANFAGTTPLFSSIYQETDISYIPNIFFRDITIGDFDLDGDTDIAALSAKSNVTNTYFFRILDGDGSGGFTAGFSTGTTLSAGINAIPNILNYTFASIASNDLDNDVDADISVVMGYTNNSTEIYTYRYDATATPIFTRNTDVIIPLAFQASNLCYGDFNLDGKRDIAVVNNTNDNARVYTNVTSALFPAPDACFQVINNNPSPGNYATSTALSLQKERDFTVEGWFKLATPAPTNDQYFFYVGRDGSNGFGMYAEATTQKLFVIGAGATPFILDLKQKAFLDTWMHFALVKEKGNLWRFYLNGIESTPLSSDNFDEPTLGGSGNGTYFGVDGSENNNMNGFLQEFRFWNTALDRKTIREWSHIQPNISHPKFFTLNSYYPMSENNLTGIMNDIAYTINRTALYKFATIVQNVASANFSADIAPVGDGGSGTTFNLTGNILNGRDKVGFEADFTGAGSPFPNGDVVISRVYDTPTNNLSTATDAMPLTVGAPISRTVFSNIYWVIENFSTNSTNYTGFLNEITFDIKNNQFIDVGGLPQSFPISSFPVTAPFPATNTQANAFEIYSRPATSNNAGDWKRVGVCNAFGSVKARKPGSVVSDFGRVQLVIGVDVTILPIHLTSFSGKRMNSETNLIEWLTTFEYKNQLFEIEKSFDAREFFRIGTEKATNTTTLTSYSFTDKYATEAAYYRLKQYDEDGKVNYSKTIFISNSKQTDFEEFSVYPNPATNEIHFKTTGINNAENLKIVIFNTMGVKMLEINGNLAEIEQTLNQNLAKMPFGLYMIQIQIENKTMKTKFIKK